MRYFLLIFFIFLKFNLYSKDFLLKKMDELSKAAKSVVLLDYNTGRILYSKNASLKWPPASLAKIVSLYTALSFIEKYKIPLDRKIIINSKSSYKAFPRDSSLMFLEEGHKVSIEELLKGIAISSGNDASLALATYLFGSIENFINFMNFDISLLNLKMSFVDSSGYSDFNEIRAKDYAYFIKKYIEKFPFMLKIHSLLEFKYPNLHNLNGHKSAFLDLVQKNKNILLKTYEGTDGIKTGFINKSGYNIAVTAKRGQRRLIVVVLGVFGDEREANLKRSLIARELLGIGFNLYREYKIAVKLKKEFLSLENNYSTLYSPHSLKLSLNEFEYKSLKVRYFFNNKKIQKFPKKNESVGYALFSSRGEDLGKLDLFIHHSEPSKSKSSIFKFFKRLKNFSFF